MPKKRDADKTHAQKVITLFSKLLFSGRKYSLTELSNLLNCSKQTVLRLVDHINSTYTIIIEEEIIRNRKYFSIKNLPRRMPLLNLTETEYKTLQMCKAFTENLLGRELFEEATRAVEKSGALIDRPKAGSSEHFAVFRPGTIDYSPHQQIIQTIIYAMDHKQVCKMVYHSPGKKTPTTFYIKPLKLFSYKDALYLHARKAITPGKKYKEPKYDPLLAVHRIRKIESAGWSFDFPDDYDFEKVFNEHFGIIKAEPFQVEIVFTDFAAGYVVERVWDPNQKIEELEDGSIKLTLTTSSTPEIISWVLSFNKEAELVEPDWLRNRIKELIQNMMANYE